jgi:hypothetical protein
MATGADVDAGTSDKLLVTPKSLKDSQVGDTLPNETVSVMPFYISSFGMVNNQTTFDVGDHYIPTPDSGNGYFYTNRGNVFTARLFVYGRIDISGTGEACLWNVSDNVQVIGSTVSFSVNQYALFKSGDFTILPNKVYAVALRRSSFTATNAYLRAALVTIKIPKA